MSEKAMSLLERREEAVPRGPFQTVPIAVQRAEGSLIYDADGREYVDFTGGIGVMNVGHGNQRVAEAMKDQIDRFVHACFHVGVYEGYVSLAERLNGLVPIEGEVKTSVFNSGAEAVENAVKMARAHTGRQAIIAFDKSFHGRTMGAVSLTGKVDPYRADFGPMLPWVYHAPYPHPYRNPFDETDPARLVERVMDYLTDTLLTTRVAPDDVAAVIIEPVAGEGGFLVPPPAFLGRLQELCRRHDMLLIVDEVQTGFGRTGAMFASERFDIDPDLVVMAKSMGAGMPISAVSGRTEVVDSPRVGSLGGTYGGNPVACAAALAVLDEFEDRELVERAREIGRTVNDRFHSWKETYDFIGDVRGLGAMQAMELVEDRSSRAPDPEVTGEVISEALDRGLVLMSAGLHGSVIRTLMPLTISDEHLEEGLAALAAALDEVERTRQRTQPDERVLT